MYNNIVAFVYNKAYNDLGAYTGECISLIKLNMCIYKSVTPRRLIFHNEAFRRDTDRQVGNSTNGGLTVLSQLKKVLITVPDTLLEQVDALVGLEKTNRSEFVREAMRRYIEEKKKTALKAQMEKGYQEMAEINLNLAKMCFEAEDEQFSAYEEKLAECE